VTTDAWVGDKPKTPGGNNENPLSSCPSRIGNQHCFADLCPTNKHAGSTLREALAAFHKKYDEAFNNGDAAALASPYTEDAVEVDEPRTDLRSDTDGKYKHIDGHYSSILVRQGDGWKIRRDTSDEGTGY
jgi:ketosteroid isomerase-like protein